MNTIGGIIDGSGIFRANHVDALTVYEHALVFIIHINRALETSMYRVVFKQGRAFLDAQVVVFAGNNRTEAKLLALTGLLHKFASSQAANSTEAEQHHITWLYVCAFFLHEVAQFFR